MTAKQVLRQLESLGTAQNRKIYARHGVEREMYGVSFANLDKLEKRIKTDHELALALWESGNHDARLLATRVADPARMGSRQLDGWARELDSYIIADAFGGLVARAGMGRRKFEQWRDRKGEFVGQVAWNLLGNLADRDPELPDAYFAEQLERIEAQVHERKNRVRYAMNLALIQIGLRSAGLERKVRAAVRRIGPIEVDHGETGCKTPDPIPYIEKTKAYRARKGQKRNAAGGSGGKR